VVIEPLPRILVAYPKPCFLQRIIGFHDRPKHPVRDRAQVRSVLLEALS